MRSGSYLKYAGASFILFIYQALVHQFNLSTVLILIFIFFLCTVLMFFPTFLMGYTLFE